MKIRKKLWTMTRKIGALIWTVVSGVSVWATSISLHISFNIPEPVAYLLGFIIVAALGLLLNEIKKEVNANRIKVSTLIWLTSLFLTVWLFSVVTNTHKFFFSLKEQDIAKETVDYASEVLTDIGKSQINDANNRIANYKALVSQKILDYYNEVMNPLNPGEGKVADSLKRIVANLLEVNEIPATSGSKSLSVAKRRVFADQMHRKMHAQLQIKVDGMYEGLQSVGNCIDTIQKASILNNLKRYDSFNTNLSSEDYKSAVTAAHIFYQKTQRCISADLSAFQRLEAIDGNDLGAKNELELPVPAIKIQRINELLPYISNYPKRKPRTYISAALYALVMAALVDVIGFVILYRVVLKKEE